METPKPFPPQALCPHRAEDMKFRETLSSWDGEGVGYVIVCPCGHQFPFDADHFKRMEQVWRNTGIGRRQAA